MFESPSRILLDSIGVPLNEYKCADVLWVRRSLDFGAGELSGGMSQMPTAFPAKTSYRSQQIMPSCDLPPLVQEK